MKLLLVNKGKCYSQSHFQKPLKKQLPNWWLRFFCCLVGVFFDVFSTNTFIVSFGSSLFLPTMISIHATLLYNPFIITSYFQNTCIQLMGKKAECTLKGLPYWAVSIKGHSNHLSSVHAAWLAGLSACFWGGSLKGAGT